eukprot:maker-scaffold94_size379870-snap-gene-2.31 protein:Tk09635 transcript:maker-scaffold94_size379870-snap-gene-2.31-mRNA-1 annotation:"hypothetical protein GV64_14105"
MRLQVLLLCLLGEIAISLQDGPCPHHPFKTCHDVLASLIFTNGQIYTVDPDEDVNWFQNPKQALVMEYGKIQFVGSNNEALAWENGESRVVNLQGKTVVPGIHDTHMHPLEAGNLAAATCLLKDSWAIDGPQTKKQLSQCKGKQQGTDWVMGWGYALEAVFEHVDNGGRDPKLILDDIMVDPQGRPLPALIMELTSHSVWINSEALRIAGIDASTPNPTAGIIMKNAQGQPNGILLENAGNMVVDMALNVTAFPALIPIFKSGLKESIGEMAENGITSVVDARAYWARGLDAIWDELEQDQDLTVRAVLAMWAYPDMEDDNQIPELRAKYRSNPNDLVQRTQIKLYADGIIDATTAAIESLNAIGNTQADQARSSRHRLTHVELVDRNDVPRFAHLDVIADAQVAGDWTLPQGGRNPYPLVSKYVGRASAKDLIPIGSLFDNGATITLSSDYDVSTMNPFVGMGHAITRGRQSVYIEVNIEG